MRDLEYICDWCKSRTKNPKAVRTVHVQDLSCHNKIIDEICVSCEKQIQQLKKLIQTDGKSLEI